MLQDVRRIDQVQLQQTSGLRQDVTGNLMLVVYQHISRYHCLVVSQYNPARPLWPEILFNPVVLQASTIITKDKQKQPY